MIQAYPLSFYVIALYVFPLKEVSAIMPSDNSDQKRALAFLKTDSSYTGSLDITLERSEYK